MQSDIITLPVDKTDTNTYVDVVFARQEVHLNRTVYIGPNHQPDMRETLTLYRSPIKNTSTFKGVMRTSFKFTKDVEVLNPVGETIVSPIIIESSFSVPVGTNSADRLEATQTAGALALFRTVMAGLIDLQSI